MSKGKIFFSAIGGLLKALLKLLLLATYLGSKVIEALASFLSKLTGKLLND